MSEVDGMPIEKRFGLAKDWCIDFLSQAIDGDEFKPLTRLMSLKAAYLHMLLVDEFEGAFSFRDFRPDTFANLVTCIQEDPYSYDLVTQLSVHGLLKEATNAESIMLQGKPVRIRATEGPPWELKIIASLMLDGTFKRPKHKGRPSNFGRDVMFYISIEHSSAMFGLNPTRAENTRPTYSGCDALRNATRQLGVEVPTFASARAIWQSRKIREYLRHLRELEIALNADRISATSH